MCEIVKSGPDLDVSQDAPGPVREALRLETVLDRQRVLALRDETTTTAATISAKVG
jgi:hypothetical protein